MIKQENEEWKSVLYNNVAFDASNLCWIRNAHGRIVGFDTTGGYTGITVKCKHVFTHRLVRMAWKPIENPELYVVNHIDNNGKNNRIENLEWVTRSENIRHYIENFLIPGSYNQGQTVK
jgi:uncharacterized protein (UPF0248 family)